MKIVIDIPEELYIAYKGRPPMLGDAGMDMITQAIANGTPLPKGHVDLKDFQKMYADMTEKEELARQRVIDTPTSSPCYMRYVAQLNERTAFKEMLYDAPTIIESDKAEHKAYEVKVITRGNCMLCGKKLTEGLLFCKECEAKGK